MTRLFEDAALNRRFHRGQWRMLGMTIVGYWPEDPVRGARIRLPAGRTTSVENPLEAVPAKAVLGSDGTLPDFSLYAIVKVKKG